MLAAGYTKSDRRILLIPIGKAFLTQQDTNLKTAALRLDHVGKCRDSKDGDGKSSN